MVHGNFENYMKQVVVGKKNIFKIISSLGGFVKALQREKLELVSHQNI
jgi:hypothetical protein